MLRITKGGIEMVKESELYDEDYLKASAQIKELVPEEHKAYDEWKKTVYKETTLDRKTKELIALSAGCALQCVYCIDTHAQKAKAFGATKKELAEVIEIAAQVKAGATISYGVNALKAVLDKD